MRDDARRDASSAVTDDDDAADYRYMACSDLLREVTRESFDKFPSRETEESAMDAVLKAVFDQAADVAGLAMKCAAAIARRGETTTAERTTRALCASVGEKKDAAKRDAACMCLKTIVREIGGFEGGAREGVLGTCAPALATHVATAARAGATADEMNVAAEAVDVLHVMMTVLSEMPHARLSEEHSAKLQETLLKHLEHGKSGTRKRAAQCLALLATFMKDDMLNQTVNMVMEVLKDKVAAKKGKSDLHTFVLGATARALGYRFGEYVDEVMPLLLRVCESSTDEYDEEVIVNIEGALQAIDNVVSSCPANVQGDEGTAARFACALKYISYDPNFDDDETEDMDTYEDEDEDVYSDDDEYNDDDDESWKVRRAAAKMLSSLVGVASEPTLSEHYDDVMSKLLARTKDREPSVQLDVFSVIGDIVRVGAKFREHDPESKMSAKLRETTTDVIRIIIRESASKSPKTQVAAFALLSSLASVFPSILSDISDAEIRSSLMNIVQRCVGDKACGSSARIEALAFVCSVCKPNNLEILEPYVRDLLPQIFAACTDKYYKLVTEALRACAAVVSVLRREDTGAVSAENASQIKSLLDAVLTKLDASDEDQDVKEAAIHASAVILATLNDHVNTQDQSRALGLLLERSRNETTRLPAVRAFAMIAGSSRPMDLSAVAAAMTSELTTFLRKANKSLRESALAALTALISSHRAALQDPDVVPIVVEASTLLSEEDLHLATLSVGLLTTIVAAASVFPKATQETAKSTMPLALKLTRSPLVQRQTLKSLQELYKNLILAGVVNFESLFEALSDTKDIQSVDSQFVAHSLAKCVAAACVAAAAIKQTMTTLLAKLQGVSGIEAVYTLLCIGEIGRLTDLSADKELETILFSAFDSYGDEVKGASALTLGRVAVGNRAKYLPLIVSKLESDSMEHQYSLLQALREVIVVGNLTEDEASKVLTILYGTASSEEEGVRNVVAECLGRLAASNPSKLIQDVHKRFAVSASPLEKATLISAIKFAVLASEKGELTKIRSELRLPEFMGAISDEDVNVRTSVIKTLTAVIHRESTLITPLLSDVLPKLLEQTAIATELVRVIDLGAFKHTVDDGLECRKSAFECVNTILDSCGGLVNARDVVVALASGLGDHYDIKMLAHAALRKLSAGVAPNSADAVLANLDAFCEPLVKTFTARVKSDAVQQEIDRNNDLLRSALRLVYSINEHAGSASVASWKTFNEESVVGGKENIAEMYARIEKENE